MDYQEILTELKKREGQKAWPRDNRALLMAYLNEVLEDTELSEAENSILNRLFRKYTVGQIAECIDIGAEKYLDVDTKNNLTEESIQKFLDKLGGILHIRYGNAGKQTQSKKQTQTAESARIERIHTSIDIAVGMIGSFADYANTVFTGLKAIDTTGYRFETEIPTPLSYFAFLLIRHIESQVDLFDNEEARKDPDILLYEMCEAVPPELGILYSDVTELPAQNGIYNPGFWLLFCRTGEMWLNVINFSVLNVATKAEGVAIRGLAIRKIREKYGNII